MRQSHSTQRQTARWAESCATRKKIMLCVNEVRLLGHLGRDPEFRTFPSGDRIATLNLCTTEKWRDRTSGEMREHAEWSRVVVRDAGTVEYLERHALKGTAVYVQGTLRTRKGTSPSGEDRYFTEVDANKVVPFPRTREGSGSQDDRSERPPSPAPAPSRASAPARQPQRPAPAPHEDDQRHQNQGLNDGYPSSQFANDDALNGPLPKF